LCIKRIIISWLTLTLNTTLSAPTPDEELKSILGRISERTLASCFPNGIPLGKEDAGNLLGTNLNPLLFKELIKQYVPESNKIKNAIERGANWDIESAGSFTLLNLAIIAADVDVVKLLLEKGAKPCGPELIAINFGFEGLFFYFIGNAMPIDITLFCEKFTIIAEALLKSMKQQGCLGTLNQAIESPLLAMPFKSPTLFLALVSFSSLIVECEAEKAAANIAKLVKLLLAYGADPNCIITGPIGNDSDDDDERTESVLGLAVIGSQREQGLKNHPLMLELIKDLLLAGADPYFSNGEGKTCIELAGKDERLQHLLVHRDKPLKLIVAEFINSNRDMYGL